MRYILIIIFFTISISACQEQVRYCDLNNVANFCFNNKTNEIAIVHLGGNDSIIVPANQEICEYLSSGSIQYNITVGDTAGPSDALTAVDCESFQIEINP